MATLQDIKQLQRFMGRRNEYGMWSPTRSEEACDAVFKLTAKEVVHLCGRVMLMEPGADVPTSVRCLAYKVGDWLTRRGVDDAGSQRLQAIAVACLEWLLPSNRKLVRENFAV